MIASAEAIARFCFFARVMSPAVGRLEANAKKGFYCRDNLGIKKFQALHQFNSLGNGVLTSRVITALADRFLLTASLLPKEVYCRSRRNNRLSQLLFHTLTPRNILLIYAYASLALSTRCERLYISCFYCLVNRRLILQPPSLCGCL